MFPYVPTYVCWVKSCKSRVNILPNGKSVPDKKYVDYNDLIKIKSLP